MIYKTANGDLFHRY